MRRSAVALVLLTSIVFANRSHAHGDAALQYVPSPLLAIDQNRATVIDRIVTQWSTLLERSGAGLSGEQLRAMLAGLRSDYLLAASLAGTLEGLRDALATAAISSAPVKEGLMHAKALGDTAADLTYTPVVPCRLVDTRNVGGQIGSNSSRDFRVWVSSGGFGAQGGANTNCNIPADPVAVVVNLTAVTPAGNGNFIAYPTGTPTFTSVLNYQAGINALANGAIVPACLPNCTNQLTIATNGAGADAVIDIVGYFKAPGAPIGTVSSVATGTGLTGGPIMTTGTISIATGGVTKPLLAASGGTIGQVLGTDGTNLVWQSAGAGGTVTSVGTGTGLTGGPITATGTINLAATNLLPTIACTTNQIPKWNGSAWACGDDSNSGGTVTSVTAGAGLTGGTITTNGTIAVDPTSSTLTGNFFRQGGNSFGATPAIFGNIDSRQPLDIYAGGGRAMRFENNDLTTPNVIAGFSGNLANGGGGRTIGGGGYPGITCVYAASAIPVSCINETQADFATVAGGIANIASGYASTVGGGYSNFSNFEGATVSGGNSNAARQTYSTISGGYDNLTIASYSAIPGGFSNVAAGTGSYAAGYGNTAGGAYSVVAGGYSSDADGTASFSAGYNNSAQGHYSTVAGGYSNLANVDYSTVVGGSISTAGGDHSIVAGGSTNTAGGGYSTVVGGFNNTALGDDSIVLGGANNTAGGSFSTVVGGPSNSALGAYSFAAGHMATVPASAPGSFLWSDSQGASTVPAGRSDEFLVVATNGIGLFTKHDFTQGCAVTGGAITCTSDRAQKTDFTAIAARDVLDRLLTIPITRWRFLSEPENIRHMGPTAQDFQVAFGLGDSDKTIGLLDASGVALAAIQGLNTKLEAQLTDKEREIAELRNRVAEIGLLRDELVVLKAMLAEMREGRTTVTAH